MNQETIPKTERQAGVSSALFDVDDVIRVTSHAGFRVWKVTAVVYGGLSHEDIIAIVPLDQHPGSIYGKAVEECLVPLSLLAGVERVGSANYKLTILPTGSGRTSKTAWAILLWLVVLFLLLFLPGCVQPAPLGDRCQVRPLFQFGDPVEIHSIREAVQPATTRFNEDPNHGY